MDESKAFDADNGFSVTDGPFYTGGTASPVGLDLPLRTFYLQTATSGVLVWRKFNTGVNDWRQLSAQDVPFDVSGLTTVSPELTGLTQTREVVSSLSGRVFGTYYGNIRFNPNFQTTSEVFVDALVLNIPNTPAGKYIVYWSYRSNNSKSNTNNQTEVRFNDAALVTNTVVGTTTSVQTPLGGGLGEQFSGFVDFSILALANLKLSIAIRRSAGNGGARANTMNLTCWRVSS